MPDLSIDTSMFHTTICSRTVHLCCVDGVQVDLRVSIDIWCRALSWKSDGGTAHQRGCPRNMPGSMHMRSMPIWHLGSIRERSWDDSEGLVRVVRRSCDSGCRRNGGFRRRVRRQHRGAANRFHHELRCLRVHNACKLNQSFVVLTLELLGSDEVEAL